MRYYWYSLCDELNALTLRLAGRLFLEKDEGAAWVVKRCVVKLLEIDLHGIIHLQNNLTSSGSSDDEMDVDEEFSEKSSQRRQRYLGSELTECSDTELSMSLHHMPTDPLTRLRK